MKPRAHGLHAMLRRCTLALVLLCAGAAAPAAGAPSSDWQACAALAQAAQRLACYDRWAARQAGADAPAATPPAIPPAPEPALAAAGAAQHRPEPPDLPDLPAPESEGCRSSRYTTLSRFWELERGSDCGTLGFRGYRPLSVSVVTANTVNQQPGSDNPLNNAGSAVPYRRTEMRVQLSVRTKLAQGLLTQGRERALDSLWFGYTQQSYWQLFSPSISRPFRNTDHEPELIYIHPVSAELPWGWRWRFGGIGLVHQSNGQSLPLSRSWNRVYLMAGLERGQDWWLTGRIWQRLHESSANDDNPHISDYVGRAELNLGWNLGASDTLSLTARHSLRAQARGSLRLEWMHRIGDSPNLRLHAALFSGYGDSLLDYNRRRTVFSLGLSLLDF
ncbi:phospholipase A [Comamonas sp. NLF-1-9]|uniref:phospholipase A n=1 Tax=Comamonas sp. NLF-1-9 TaxID=2853163 RepID=UPI001C46D9EC|nr:phospholipase A [Comamonas sp. NLF-1-9]QXL84178.1 phospholipase A [Comamonas sp. NLF-1-9]